MIVLKILMWVVITILVLPVVFVFAVHATGVPIYITKAGIRIGEIRWFRYYKLTK